MACMAASGTGLLVFIDDVTDDRSNMMNSEVYRLCSLLRLSRMLIRQCFTVQIDNEQKDTENILQWLSQ